MSRQLFRSFVQFWLDYRDLILVTIWNITKVEWSVATPALSFEKICKSSIASTRNSNETTEDDDKFLPFILIEIPSRSSHGIEQKAVISVLAISKALSPTLRELWTKSSNYWCTRRFMFCNGTANILAGMTLSRTLSAGCDDCRWDEGYEVTIFLPKCLNDDFEKSMLTGEPEARKSQYRE